MRGDAIPFVLPLDGGGDPDTGDSTNVPRVADFSKGAVHFVLTGAADVTVQMSLSDAAPANFVDVPLMIGLTAGNAIVALPDHNVRWLKVVVNTAVTAGDSVTFAGLQGRTD